MNIGVLGCGYVSDFYIRTVNLHKNLKIKACFDKDNQRGASFSRVMPGIKQYFTAEDMLKDPNLDIIINLTNPREHFELNKQILLNGKHLYSEKPLTFKLDELKQIYDIAIKNDLYVSSAPCNYLSETAQTVLKAIKEGVIGVPKIVYAEMDDGYIYKRAYRDWINSQGVNWPFKDEFEVGCVLEHAGYYITWLTMFFGPAESVTSFSDCIINKEVKINLGLIELDAPDFSVAIIKFKSGVVARLTCSIIAPQNHELLLIGDDGVINVKNCWDYGAEVRIKKMVKESENGIDLSKIYLNYPLVSEPKKIAYHGGHKMDFCRGVAHLENFISNKYSNKLLIDFCMHNTEIALAINESSMTKKQYFLNTSFSGFENYEYESK